MPSLSSTDRNLSLIQRCWSEENGNEEAKRILTY